MAATLDAEDAQLVDLAEIAGIEAEGSKKCKGCSLSLSTRSGFTDPRAKVS
jgi:hypothetical protein